MSLSWILLCSTLPSLVHLSAPGRCPVHRTYSPHNESPLLDSLQCYNDYSASVFCEWREHGNLTLWVQIETDSRTRCSPDDAELHDAGGHRMSRCRYKTRNMGSGIYHTAFFLQEQTEALCSSAPHKPLAVSEHVRARPPVCLSTRDAGDGGRQLNWSSPYPSSSSLSRNITYQLSYRPDGQEHWETELVTNMGLKLERTALLPGRRYTARVRARASLGQWSHWSPVVTWQTADNTGQFPSLDCVLDGEQEVMCSWEVSREQAHFITYQLACRHNRTALYETCCVDPVVTSEPGRTELSYSCSLRPADPARLQLQLRPVHTAKVFHTSQHIQPNPPEQVRVKEKNNIWVVEWTKSSTSSNFELHYQLCYYMIKDKNCDILDVPEGSLSLNILHTSLIPSEQYQVKVRALIAPGLESLYRGIPSEWTEPVTWTGHEAGISLTTIIYFSISLLVGIVFFILYCTVTTCQRKVILWVDSVPSPRKSKIISEIQIATSRALLQTENQSMCKVQHMDSVSTYCSDTSLWPATGCGRGLQQDEGCWTCVPQGSCATEVNSSAMSALSFSGPYIFCQASCSQSLSSVSSQVPESKQDSVDVSCEETQEPPSSDEPAPHPHVNLRREGYVCLPSHSQDQRHADTTLQADKSQVQPGLGVEAPGSLQPPAYTPGPVTSWPQEGAVQASGYFQIPTG